MAIRSIAIIAVIKIWHLLEISIRCFSWELWPGSRVQSTKRLLRVRRQCWGWGDRAGQRPVRTAFRAEAGNEAEGHRLCALSALPAALGGTVFSLGSISGRKYSTWVTLLCSKAKKSPSGKLILFYICNEYIFFPESRPKLVPWF